uniref:HORMA domain containing 1 n=1 Tax=Oncorhynchus mykiss TaxID=8022 RepID=A0A8K9UWQ5_ONCMY
MLIDRAVSNRVRIFNLCAALHQTTPTTEQIPYISTEQQSLIVVKKLLAIAVSSITYLRGLFPEKAYGRKFKVMILREERTCPGASQIVQWMQGCFDALQRKYVSEILKVTECYQFKVQYTEKGPKIDFERYSFNLGKMACSNTKKSSILLVRKLYTLMQNLGPLPDNVCLNMKLSYYDDGKDDTMMSSRLKEKG